MGNKTPKTKNSLNNSTSNNQQFYPQQQQMIYQQNIGQNFDDFNNIGLVDSNQGITRLNKKQDDDKKKTVAVIVTFSHQGTYDQLFTQVQQKAQQGTKVLVYKASVFSIQAIQKAFKQQYQNDSYKQLIKQINSVDKDCVVFNWECCGHYGNENFNEGTQKIFKFIKYLIDRGFMTMFSDFSLKALIKNWNQNQLGPNPFEKIGEILNSVQLRFSAGQLKQCPSAQLQTVGQMAQQGKVNVHTMGGTILYTVNKDKLTHEIYTLKVLTVASNMKVSKQNLKCKIGQFQGAAGHVLIKYPSSGCILTSMTHWIELMKVDTSEQKLFEVAQRSYGANYAQQQRMQYQCLDQSRKKQWRAQKAKNFIQNQAPCTNMSKKARY